MKLDLKTLFVGLAICFSYNYANNQTNKDNTVFSIITKPSVNIITLTN